MEAVYATGKPVILFLLFGSVLTINWADEHIPAIIEVWYSGDQGIMALYPFGYGLSYTKFSYSSITISSENINSGESIEVKAKVKNVGSFESDEVLQIVSIYTEYCKTAIR